MEKNILDDISSFLENWNKEKGKLRDEHFRFDDKDL